MSHRTRERPAECLASLSHSTMIGLPRAARELVHSLQMYCKLFSKGVLSKSASPAAAPYSPTRSALYYSIVSFHRKHAPAASTLKFSRDVKSHLASSVLG
ncbi:hypothetical protein EVAR_59515_1 [Eumeta japonica]|uniref:Uncharacterized protein n=1 Tax=Eumeta variegata TaxID=151549 RepID=A0A4C1XTI7_EUMVA|nr:hypothetical protein EVAR_59515_1 [Eumeta japonica]